MTSEIQQQSKIEEEDLDNQFLKFTTLSLLHLTFECIRITRLAENGVTEGLRSFDMKSGILCLDKILLT